MPFRMFECFCRLRICKFTSRLKPMAKIELAELVKSQAYGPSEEGQQFAKELGKFLFWVHFFPKELERLVEGRQEVMERKARSARSVTFNVETPAIMAVDGDRVLDTCSREVIHKRCSIQMMDVFVVSLWCAFSKQSIPLPVAYSMDPQQVLCRAWTWRSWRLKWFFAVFFFLARRAASASLLVLTPPIWCDFQATRFGSPVQKPNQAQ